MNDVARRIAMNRLFVGATVCLLYIAAVAYDVDMSVASGTGCRAWVDGRRLVWAGVENTIACPFGHHVREGENGTWERGWLFRGRYHMRFPYAFMSNVKSFE